MTNISICICTRNRKEGLNKLLDSIENLEIPSETNIRIVIVENESKNISENIIKDFSSKSKFKINYFLETKQGLSFARNKSVKEANGCEFCCFVDDDQIVAPDWLSELMRCQREFDSDGVWGTNPPVFIKEVPLFIKQFHTPKLFNYGAVVKSAFTNCLMIRKEYLDRIEGPFDLRLNFTGGEDSYLTNLITNLGAVIRYNPNARAYEIIPDDRTTVKYLIKRTYRISNAELLVKSLIDKEFSKLNVIPRLIRRFCYGLLIVVPFFLFGGKDKLKGLISMINAIGGFSFILGKQNNFYKLQVQNEWVKDTN